MSENTNTFITGEVYPYQITDRTLSFIPKLSPAADDHFKELVTGKIKISLYDFSNGKGDNGIYTYFNLDLKQFRYIYERAKLSHLPAPYESSKIHCQSVETDGPFKGYCKSFRFYLARNATYIDKKTGETCTMRAPWYLKITNGYALPGKDGKGEQRNSFKQTGKRIAIYSWRLVKTDKNPSEKRKSALSLREMIKNIEKDKDDGILTYEAQTITVYQLIRRYLKSKVTLANSTLQNYIHLTEKNIRPHNLGQMKVSNVKKSDIKNFFSYLYTERHFAVSTIQLYQNIFFPAFQMAVDDDLIRKNPCKDCMKEYIRGGLSTTKYPLTRAEEAALLKFVKDDTIYSVYYPMIAFMLGTGCRIGEVIGLTWDDIDFENATLSINHQIIYKKKNGKIRHYASAPKNGTSRIIPLSDDVLDILLLYKQRTYFMSITNDYEVDGYSNFVFLNQNMTLYTPNTLTRAFHNIRNAYNRFVEDGEIKDVLLPDFTAHTFRHTFCTRMAENGMDIKVLQEIMGHKTIAVTMQVYNHALFERKQSEVARIPSALAV